VTDGYTHALPALRNDVVSMTVEEAAQRIIDVLMPEHVTPLDEAMLLTRRRQRVRLPMPHTAENGALE
jgi:hypothetical protein